MQKTLKRLELIKTAISLEDEEIIELQVMKLSTVEDNEALAHILDRIESKDYGAVVLAIEDYLERFAGMVVYEDRELQGLRLELKVLEKKLQELSGLKSEYLNDIEGFNVLYHLRLGEIIQKILRRKEEILAEAIRVKKEAFEAIKEEYQELKEGYENLKSQKEAKEQELEALDEFDDGYDEKYEAFRAFKEALDEKEEELNEKRKETKQAKEAYEEDEVAQEYEEVKKDSDEFHKEYEEIKKEERVEINEQERAELKKLYRKASRLCHPDLVSQELREQATQMMKALNSAYAKQDINAVKEILISLENGRGFDVASDTIQDKTLLKEKIVEVREMINENEEEIERIKEDEIMEILSEYEDIEVYFDKVEEQLEAEYERLKNSEVEEDSYWSDEF